VPRGRPAPAPADRRAARAAGFPPLFARDARLLVLGSLPGVRSLQAREYYAQPRNAFWTIIGELTGAAPQLPYAERTARLIAARVALWDVCRSARRAGSLDAAIERDSVICNDFAGLYAELPALAGLCFNGRAAAHLYERHVLPGLGGSAAELPRLVLPSTSPAHAALGYAAKREAWAAAFAGLGADRVDR
jgi:double-stranded uracil-DNA glycosylase